MSNLLLSTNTFRVLLNEKDLADIIHLRIGSPCGDRLMALLNEAKRKYPNDVELKHFFNTADFGKIKIGIVRMLDDPELLN